MNKEGFTEYFHKQLGISDSYQAPERLMEILFNREEREELFHNMLEFMDYGVDKDWFHQYFEDEHADRKKKKQDFTPNDIGRLAAKLVQIDAEVDDYYEIAAGTGGLMIQHWNEMRMKESPFTYSTWEHFHTVEELSDRTIPFLLFNMLIRGMNGVVMHVDTIERDCKGIFFVHNFYDDHLSFSDLNVLPYTEYIEDMFNVNFTEEKYPEYVERSWFDEENWADIERIIAMRELERESLGELEESDLEDEVKEFIKYFGLYR